MLLSMRFSQQISRLSTTSCSLPASAVLAVLAAPVDSEGLGPGACISGLRGARAANSERERSHSLFARPASYRTAIIAFAVAIKVAAVDVLM